jgi:hypothetical protein
MDPSSEHHVRALIEQLVREGRSEREITTEVRRVHADGVVPVRRRWLTLIW